MASVSGTEKCWFFFIKLKQRHSFIFVKSKDAKSSKSYFFILLEGNCVEIKTLIIILKFQENFWVLLFSDVDVLWYLPYLITDIYYLFSLFPVESEAFNCHCPPQHTHTYFLLFLVFFYLIHYYSFAIHLLYSMTSSWEIRILFLATDILINYATFQ